MGEDYVEKLIELSKKSIKNIELTEKNTIIEFEDNQKVVLLGGKQMVGEIKHIPRCSYCGKERCEKTPMISPDNDENILICASCVSEAAALFLKSGVDLDLNIYLKNKNGW